MLLSERTHTGSHGGLERNLERALYHGHGPLPPLASSPPYLGSLYLEIVNPTGFPFVFLFSQPDRTRAREPGCVGAAR